MTAEEYIDAEFLELRTKGAIGGSLTAEQLAMLKCVFIGGISAALGYDGTDLELAEGLVPALRRVSVSMAGAKRFHL